MHYLLASRELPGGLLEAALVAVRVNRGKNTGLIAGRATKRNERKDRCGNVRGSSSFARFLPVLRTRSSRVPIDRTYAFAGRDRPSGDNGREFAREKSNRGYPRDILSLRITSIGRINVNTAPRFIRHGDTRSASFFKFHALRGFNIALVNIARALITSIGIYRETARLSRRAIAIDRNIARIGLSPESERRRGGDRRCRDKPETRSKEMVGRV